MRKFELTPQTNKQAYLGEIPCPKEKNLLAQECRYRVVTKIYSQNSTAIPPKPALFGGVLDLHIVAHLISWMKKEKEEEEDRLFSDNQSIRCCGNRLRDSHNDTLKSQSIPPTLCTRSQRRE